MSTKKSQEESDKPTFILLLRGLWDVDNPAALIDIVWRNFRKKLVYCEDPSADGGATNVLGIAFPNIFIQFDGFFFHILTIPEPFFEDREAVAAQMGELRLRQAVLDHEAYISVSLLNAPPGTDPDEATRLVGRMTAALGRSPATLAVAAPALKQLRVWDRNIRKALRTECPTSALTATPPSQVPVVPGDAGDADLKAATEEARRRWPEFVAAYANRRPDQLFAVKAPFTEGEFTEHMWIKVLKIEDEYLQGVIDNDPVNVKKYPRGTRVRLRVRALSDWMYTDGDNLIGEFTNKALDRAAEKRIEQIRREREQAGDNFEEDPDEDDSADEEPARPAAKAASARPKGSSGALLWVLLGVGAVVLLVCGGAGVGLTVWLLRPRPADSPTVPVAQRPPEQPPRKPRLRPQGGNSGEHIARDFAEALARRDFHAAYTCTTLAFQERQSEEQFREAVTASRVLDGRLPFSLDPAGPATPRAVRFNLRNQGAGGRHPPAAVVDTVNDEGWWVDRAEWNGPAPVEVARPGLGPPPPPPPPPTPPPAGPKRLRERGGNSDQHIVYDFARALSNRDVKAAYACASPDFQQKQSLEQFTKAVADSKILEGPMPLQPEFDRAVAPPEKRWNLRHFRVPARTPHAAVVHAKPDSLGWWITEVEWPGR